MKVAVACEDREAIAHHFGRCSYFIVFDVDSEKVSECSLRPNTFTLHAKGECGGDHEHHDQPHSHSSIVAALKDCDAVLCYNIGGRASQDLRDNGIEPFLIDDEVTPVEAVQRFMAGILKPAAGACKYHS